MLWLWRLPPRRYSLHIHLNSTYKLCIIMVGAADENDISSSANSRKSSTRSSSRGSGSQQSADYAVSSSQNNIEESPSFAKTEISSIAMSNCDQRSEVSSFAFSSNAGDDDESRSEASELQYGYSNVSTAGSGISMDDCSLDSIDRLLMRLEMNDALLTELVIDCRKMDKESAVEIGLNLPTNTHVQKMLIKAGKRSRHRDMFLDVASGLSSNSSIKQLIIEGAVINREIANALVPTFIHGKSLQHISMINCKGIGLAQLFVAMQRNERITHLRFESCYWEEHNSDLLASALPVMNITSLSLVDVNVPDNGGLAYLFRNIMNCQLLKHLDLSRNQLESASVRLLCSRLANQKCITDLKLQWCDLNDLSIKELARGVEDHPTLTCIDISQNIMISDIGVVYLIDLLTLNNRITKLNVDDCGLHMGAINAIESALRYNNSSLKLLLSRNIYDIFVGSGSSGRKDVIGHDGTIAEGSREDSTLASIVPEDGKAIQVGANIAAGATIDDMEEREDTGVSKIHVSVLEDGRDVEVVNTPKVRNTYSRQFTDDDVLDDQPEEEELDSRITTVPSGLSVITEVTDLSCNDDWGNYCIVIQS